MFQIVLNYPSPHVRLVLRVYFNVILPFLGIVGDQCCRKRAQLKLLQGKGLDLTHTTGWMSGASAAYTMYALRRSPAGWLGIIMVVTSVLWLAADLITSGFVVTVNVVDRCTFNTTIPYVVIDRKSEGKVGPFTTGNVGATWDIITHAIQTNKQNGGVNGIFHKVNTDPNFRADESDMIGSWKCQQLGQDSYYPAHNTVQSVVEDLLSRDLLYEYYAYSDTRFIGVNSYVQLGAWSSSVDDWSGQLANETAQQIIDSDVAYQWDVRASIDLSPNPEDMKVMRSYQCSMDTTDLDYVRGKIQPATTMSTYINNMRSNVYHYFTLNITAIDDPAESIATVLNVILMMGTAYHAGNNNPPPVIADPTQGCMAPRTKVPIEVILIWLIITLTTIAIFLYWIGLTLRVGVLSRKIQPSDKTVSQTIPNGLLGWILHAVKTTGVKEVDEYNILNKWILLPSRDKAALNLVQKSGAPAVPTYVANAAAEPWVAMTPLLADPKQDSPQFTRQSFVTNQEITPAYPGGSGSYYGHDYKGRE